MKVQLSTFDLQCWISSYSYYQLILDATNLCSLNQSSATETIETFCTARVNLHESKFVVLAFQFYLLSQIFTSVQQYLSISFQDPIWVESADKHVKSSYILDATLHLNWCILESSIISRSKGLLVLIPCRSQSRGFLVLRPLSPSPPSPLLFLGKKKGTTRYKYKSIQIIWLAGAIRKDPSSCHCPQSLESNHSALWVPGSPSLGHSCEHSCCRIYRDIIFFPMLHTTTKRFTSWSSEAVEQMRSTS